MRGVRRMCCSAARGIECEAGVTLQRYRRSQSICGHMLLAAELRNYRSAGVDLLSKACLDL